MKLIEHIHDMIFLVNKTIAHHVIRKNNNNNKYKLKQISIEDHQNTKKKILEHLKILFKYKDKQHAWLSKELIQLNRGN